MTKVYFKQKRKEKSCAGLLLANAQRARNSANGVSKDQTEEEELNNSKVETCSSSPQANQEISSEDRNSHHPDIASSSSATTCRSSNCFNMDEGILTRDVEMDFSDEIPTFSHNNTSIPGLSIVPKDATVLPISSQNDLRDPKAVIRDVTAAQKRKNLAKKKINFRSRKRLPQSTKSRNAVPDFSQNVQTSIAFGGNSTKIGFRGLPSNALSRPNPVAITQTCSTSQPITRSHPLVAPPVSYQLPKCSNSLAEKIRVSCGQARRSAAESSSTESHVDTNSKKKVYRIKFVQKSREIPKKK
ncbi:uncharacterized protein CELE_Y48G1BM.6 [Caenorhabditis elegans]|uniref:Uncharacterized protein n=1 Tax=Caenorhabditis elegans TaxID=6239 RepID=UPI00192DD0DA|nr:Uncharacterized protein CELE_Y48G1BM.6 [Caenorhabditis elegans]CCD73455.2 Uncharacterized protein CELE_Y48G1BM.6 [Caenorhabditis elegans]